MGFLRVDKPAGWTSHDVVAVARGALGTRKVGHAGTLDPFATGLLVLGFGPATRLLEYLVGLDKGYEGVIRLGVATETLDPEGEETARDDDWRGLSPARIAEAVAGMTGPLQQTPPAYSAIKVRGVPAHRRTRRGERVELPVRKIVVRSMELLERDAASVRRALPELAFRVCCSSGTYVRSLAAELGARLGTSCHLAALRRTRVGSLRVEGAASVPALQARKAPADAWLAPAAALAHVRRVRIGADRAARLAAGASVPVDVPDAAPVAATLPGGRVAAVGAVRQGVFAPRKVFHDPRSPR